MYDQLYPSQDKQAQWILDPSLRSSNAAALFSEQGVGKTYVALGVTEKLLEEYEEFHGLFVVPSANIETTWERKLALIEPKLNICRTWQEFMKSEGSSILLVSHDDIKPRKRRKLKDGSLSKIPDSEYLIRKVVAWHWSLILWDESQTIKSRSSGLSRTAARFHTADWKVILTGTPFDDLLKDPQQIWSQFRFLAPEVFGTRWQDFEDEFLYSTGFMGYEKRFRKDKLSEVLMMAEPFCLRELAEDVLDLDPPIFKRVPVLLSGKQKAIYFEMEKEMVVELSTGEESSADLKVTQYVRLQQIAGGFINDDEGDIHYIGRAKLLRLRSIVRKSELPIVVFCKYIEELNQLEESLADFGTVATIQGKNKKTRTEVQDKFQNGDIDILVVQVRTGGVGIDLFRACIAVFYSTTFSFIDFEQAWKRLHRNGQERQCTFYLLYANDTLDEVIFDTVLLKKHVNKKVLRGFIKNRRRHHGSKIYSTRSRGSSEGFRTGSKASAKKRKQSRPYRRSRTR